MSKIGYKINASVCVGGSPHSYAVEDAFKKNIIFGKRFEDLEVGGDVNEDCKSRICNWLCNK